MAKKLPITKVNIGDVVAEDVLTTGNTLLVQKGTVITDSVMELFSNNSIFMIVVEEENLEQGTMDDSYFASVRASDEFKEFKSRYERSIERFKASMNAIVTEKASINVDALLEEAISISSANSKKYTIMDFMMNMRDYDDSTFCHSMNVALICRVFCEWLHWPEEDMEMATVCGLLHDIGKMQIPDSIVKKPGKLTEEEFNIMKNHPVYGYKILENHHIDERIKKAALSHHEKCDGSGYPFGLKADKLDRFTKLVTIADIYDAMTANRVYRGAMSPFAVVSAFEREGLQKYDPKLILCFLQNIANSFLNNKVTLSNGHEGKVIFINKGNLSRPTVLCGDEFVDLSSNPNITIEKMG